MAKKRRERQKHKAATAQQRRSVIDRRPLWWMLGAMAAAAVVYANMLHNPFVYDDLFVVVGNASIRQLGQPLALIMHDVFRPVVNLSYAVDFTLWGLRPFGFHLTSLLLHVLNVALMFTVARRLRSDHERRMGEDVRDLTAVEIAAALLFAVHPLLSEAVGYASARSELLCTAFLLASFLALRRFLLAGGWRPLSAGLVLFVLALASKETAAMLPLMLLAWDCLLLPADGRRVRTMKLHLPLTAVILVAGLARVWIYLGVEQSGQVQDLWHNLLVAVVVLWRYLALLLVPLGLSVVHSVRSVHSLADPVVLLSLAGLAVLVTAGFVLRRRLPLVVLGGAWFLLLLAPSHLIPLQEAMAEHRSYTAACGAFLALAAGAWRLAQWWSAGQPPARRRWAAVAGAAVVVALAVLTVARNRVWADPVSLWADAASKAPATWAAQYAYADALREAGRCGEAVPAYRRAIELQPRMVDAHLNAAICLAQLGQLQESWELLHAARGLAPDNPKVYNNLGVLAAKRGQVQVARDLFGQALQKDPTNIRARQALAQLAEQAFADPARALELCREILTIAPGTPGAAACVERNRRALGAS